MAFNMFDEFQSITVVVINTYIVPSLADGSLYKRLLGLLTWPLKIFDSFLVFWYKKM